MRLYGWVFVAVLGIFAVSATFSRLFSGFMAGVWVLFWGFLQFQLLFLGFFRIYGWGLGAVLGISAVSATFFWLFSGFWAEFGVLFWGFLQFQLPFLGFFPAFGLDLGAVLGISAVSATFCEASGIMVEAQHHKLTTTY